MKKGIFHGFLRVICVLLIFLLTVSLVVGGMLALYVKKKVEKNIDESLFSMVGSGGDTELYYYVRNEDTGELETIRLSTTTRLDLNHSVYSKESPFGKAILKKKVGDRVLVRVSEDNSYYVVIKSITKGQDDESIPLNGY